MRRIVYTRHAETVAAERQIAEDWVERAIVSPDWTRHDPSDPQLMHAYRAIVERDNRVLRVVYARSRTEIRIVSVFFDRGAKRPQ